MFLDTTLKSLEIILGAVRTTTDMPVTVDYVDITSTTTTPGGSDTTSNGTTVATILAAPAASTQRKVNGITVYNADTVPQVVTIRLNNNATLRPLISVTLGVSEVIGYTDVRGWYVQDANGNLKTAASNLYTSTTSNLLGTASTKLPSVDCTQSGGALTFSGTAQYWDFRNVSLTNGTPATVNCAPANLVLPSGGTLGGVSGQTTRIVRAIMNNAGTAEYAIANIAGGLSMTEEDLISTTAIGAGSTANNVWYSTTARTNLAYRIDSAYDVVNTAGAWGNPTTKINAGGNALTAMSSLGYGQTWQDVHASRTLGTTYYNTTGKPIQVNAEYTSTATALLSISINGGAAFSYATAPAGIGMQGYVEIPIGASYVITMSAGTPTQIQWYELR